MKSIGLLLILSTLPVYCADQSAEEERQLGGALNVLKQYVSSYCADRSAEEEKQLKAVLDLLKRCAPDDFSLFAAGCIQQKEPFAVYHSVDKKHYEVSIYFDNKLHKISVEEPNTEMNTPPCRHDACNTLQLPLMLDHQLKYLCLTDDILPRQACFGDQPRVLSVHEPPPLKESVQVKLIKFFQEAFDYELLAVPEPSVLEASAQAKPVDDSQNACYDDWPIGT